MKLLLESSDFALPSPSFPPPLTYPIFLARLRAVTAAAVEQALIGDDVMFMLRKRMACHREM